MARLKLKPRFPKEPEPAPEQPRRLSPTERRALRRPEKGAPEKRKPVGPGNAKTIPGYCGTGEPSQFRPEYIDLMYAFFDRDPWEIHEDSKGVPRVMPKDKLPTMARFARTIGFHHTTLYKWTQRHPEFAAAHAECLKMQETFILESGGLTLNGNFAAFMLRCNHGMREAEPVDPGANQPIGKVVVEVVGADKNKGN